MTADALAEGDIVEVVVAASAYVTVGQHGIVTDASAPPNIVGVALGRGGRRYVDRRNLRRLATVGEVLAAVAGQARGVVTDGAADI